MDPLANTVNLKGRLCSRLFAASRHIYFMLWDFLTQGRDANINGARLTLASDAGKDVTRQMT